MSPDRLNITVVTANYNSGKYSDDYLKGLIKQKRKPNRVIIVDDASTDDSWDVILKNCHKILMPNDGAPPSADIVEFHAKDIDWLLIKKDVNEGPAATRNVALKNCLSNTDVVCINDIDDYYYPDKIKKSVEVMCRYKDVALVYSDYDVYNEQKNTQEREYKESFSYHRLYNECIVSNGSVIAASIFDKVGLYDEEIFGPEDYDLWLRISEMAAVYHIPEALYCYRITGNNITITTKQEKFARHLMRVHQKKLERTH